jgi:hypothetical protein
VFQPTFELHNSRLKIGRATVLNLVYFFEPRLIRFCTRITLSSSLPDESSLTRKVFQITSRIQINEEISPVIREAENFK